jgi:hypothetical protein
LAIRCETTGIDVIGNDCVLERQGASDTGGIIPDVIRNRYVGESSSAAAVEDAAAVGGGIAADGAVDKGHLATAVDDAPPIATARGRVTADGAVFYSQRASVVNTAATPRRVVANGAVGESQRASVGDATPLAE